MTNEQAWEKAKNGENVYIVVCEMYQYFPVDGIIVGVSASYGNEIEFEVQDNIFKKSLDLEARQIFETIEQAAALAEKAQKENGRVIITQKECDEYHRLKSGVM